MIKYISTVSKYLTLINSGVSEKLSCIVQGRLTWYSFLFTVLYLLVTAIYNAVV